MRFLPFGSTFAAGVPVGRSTGASGANGSGDGVSKDVAPRKSESGVLGAKVPSLTFLPPADALPNASGALAILTLLGLGLGAATLVALLFLGGLGQDAAQRE